MRGMTIGTQVWVNPKEQLATSLMIQEFQGLVYDVQRDFDAAVIQARLN